MVSRFLILVRGLSSSWIGAAGVVLTTCAALFFAIFELLRMAGTLTNAYVGLLTYLVFPAIFMAGLLLIPLGWWSLMRRTGLSSRELLQAKFPPEFIQEQRSGSSLATAIGLLTVLNVAILSWGSSRMLRFMDGPTFCGTACHNVMGPQWAAYQQSPHARVPCVDCHVGEGAEALVDAKLNGLRQMVAATFDLHAKPVPTPVHTLRTAQDTCAKCHWPDAAHGRRLKQWVHYQQDEHSTPRYTTLALKVGSGTGKQSGEIHWHVAASHEVRYVADAKRQTMLWVEARQPDGTYRRYDNPDAIVSEEQAAPARTLDCIDCHNREGHVFEDPEEAIDERLSQGELDPSLPFIKRYALSALTASYPSEEAAMQGIHRKIWSRYRKLLGDQSATRARAIDAAVAVLQQTYRRNVHPAMRVGWNTYPDHLGHEQGTNGCFRCHGSSLVDQDGQGISGDCTLCHSILAYDSDAPFHYLAGGRGDDREAEMRAYFREELLESRP